MRTGLIFGCCDDAAIHAPQKVDARVGIVFPAVLAVEDDANQRGPVAGVAAGGVADGLELADEVAHGVLGRVALVVEADLVAHGVVAEDDLQRLALLFHAPGTVEHLRIAEIAVAVARHPAVGRTGEDFFVGADPLNAGVGDQPGMMPWQTEPSEGHIPRGFWPKSFSWNSTARRRCSRASSA